MPLMERVPGRSAGRSVGSAWGNIVYAVATADDKGADLKGQVAECFSKVDAVLEKLGSNRASILSVSIFMSDLAEKATLDELWSNWVGSDPQGWPQRSCLGAVLGPGTLVEMTAVAVR